MNARLAFGGLLLLGIADLGLINFKLAPDLAKQQAELAMGKPATSSGSSASTSPAVNNSGAKEEPPHTVAQASSTPEPPQSAEPLPSATAEPPASAEPPTSAEPDATEEPPAPEPPATAEPVATAPEPVAEAPPTTSGDKPGPVEDILFSLDSNRLDSKAKTILEEVVRQLKANPSLKVHIRGHSDQMGARDHNLELSRKRAASVENFLYGNGIPGSRITTEAVGGRKPVDPSNTPAAWARNRRVEIEWR